jgi:putative cyclase
MLDIAALQDVDQLPASYGIGADELAAATERQGVAVEQGDVVLVRTGRFREWPNAEAFLYDEPGLNLEGAKWLVEHGAMIVCSDNVAIEQMPTVDESTWCPVHMYLFNEAGVPIIEVVNCEDLSANSVYEFAFLGLPLKLRGASPRFVASHCPSRPGNPCSLRTLTASPPCSTRSPVRTSVAPQRVGCRGLPRRMPTGSPVVGSPTPPRTSGWPCVSTTSETCTRVARAPRPTRYPS